MVYRSSGMQFQQSTDLFSPFPWADLLVRIGRRKTLRTLLSSTSSLQGSPWTHATSGIIIFVTITKIRGGKSKTDFPRPREKLFFFSMKRQNVVSLAFITWERQSERKFCFEQTSTHSFGHSPMESDPAPFQTEWPSWVSLRFEKQKAYSILGILKPTECDWKHRFWCVNTRSVITMSQCWPLESHHPTGCIPW